MKLLLHLSTDPPLKNHRALDKLIRQVLPEELIGVPGVTRGSLHEVDETFTSWEGPYPLVHAERSRVGLACEIDVVDELLEPYVRDRIEW